MIEFKSMRWRFIVLDLHFVSERSPRIFFKSRNIILVEFSFPLEEFIYNYLITLSFYIIPKKGV